MKTHPYKGGSYRPRWMRGKCKWLRTEANRIVRNRSKSALAAYIRTKDTDKESDYNDFLCGVGYWD